jgi:hypothetical protein
MNIGISSATRDGRIVAYSQGATFLGSDLQRLGAVNTYVVTFHGHDIPTDAETVTIYAIDDETALEYVRAKFIAPFQIAEKIVTWRAVVYEPAPNA